MNFLQKVATEIIRNMNDEIIIGTDDNNISFNNLNFNRNWNDPSNVQTNQNGITVQKVAIKQEPEQIIEDDNIDFESEIINGNVFHFENVPAEANNYTILLESSNNAQETSNIVQETIIEDIRTSTVPTPMEMIKVNGVTTLLTTKNQKKSSTPLISNKIVKSAPQKNDNFKDKTKIHECDVCNVKFQRSYQLKRHKFIGIHEFKNNVDKITVVQTASDHSNFNDVIEETIIGLNNNENDGNDNIPIVYQVYYENDDNYSSIDQQQLINTTTTTTIDNNCNTSYSTEDADEIDNDDMESLTCEYCHANFELIDHLDSHLQQHNRKGFYRCELCDAKFNYLEILKNHVTSHVFNKPFKCDLCEQSFMDVVILKGHIKCHRDGKNFRYKCYQCNELFLNNEQLTAHLYMHNGVKAFKCEWCSRVFIHNIILKKHISMHHT